MTLTEFTKTINKRYYVAEARECKSDKLIVTMASANRKYILHKKEYGTNMLFVATKKTSYYLINPGSIVKKLREVIVEASIKSVIFVGGSKGGFGALLWGGAS